MVFFIYLPINGINWSYWPVECRRCAPDMSGARQALVVHNLVHKISVATTGAHNIDRN